METLLVAIVTLGMTGLCRLLFITHPDFGRKMARYLIFLMIGMLLSFASLDALLNILPTDKIRNGIVDSRKHVYALCLLGILISVFLIWLSLQLEDLKKRGK